MFKTLMKYIFILTQLEDICQTFSVQKFKCNLMSKYINNYGKLLCQQTREYCNQIKSWNENLYRVIFKKKIPITEHF